MASAVLDKKEFAVGQQILNKIGIRDPIARQTLLSYGVNEYNVLLLDSKDLLHMFPEKEHYMTRKVTRSVLQEISVQGQGNTFADEDAIINDRRSLTRERGNESSTSRRGVFSYTYTESDSSFKSSVGTNESGQCCANCIKNQDSSSNRKLSDKNDSSSCCDKCSGCCINTCEKKKPSNIGSCCIKGTSCHLRSISNSRSNKNNHGCCCCKDDIIKQNHNARNFDLECKENMNTRMIEKSSGEMNNSRYCSMEIAENSEEFNRTSTLTTDDHEASAESSHSISTRSCSEVYVDPSLEPYLSSDRVMSIEEVNSLIRNTVTMMITKSHQAHNRPPHSAELEEMAKQMVEAYPCLSNEADIAAGRVKSKHETILKKLKKRIWNISSHKNEKEKRKISAVLGDSRSPVCEENQANIPKKKLISNTAESNSRVNLKRSQLVKKNRSQRNKFQSNASEGKVESVHENGKISHNNNDIVVKGGFLNDHDHNQLSPQADENSLRHLSEAKKINRDAVKNQPTSAAEAIADCSVENQSKVLEGNSKVLAKDGENEMEGLEYDSTMRNVSHDKALNDVKCNTGDSNISLSQDIGSASSVNLNIEMADEKGPEKNEFKEISDLKNRSIHFTIQHEIDDISVDSAGVENSQHSTNIESGCEKIEVTNRSLDKRGFCGEKKKDCTKDGVSKAEGRKKKCTKTNAKQGSGSKNRKRVKKNSTVAIVEDMHSVKEKVQIDGSAEILYEEVLGQSCNMVSQNSNSNNNNNQCLNGHASVGERGAVCSCNAMEKCGGGPQTKSTNSLFLNLCTCNFGGSVSVPLDKKKSKGPIMPVNNTNNSTTILADGTYDEGSSMKEQCKNSPKDGTFTSNQSFGSKLPLSEYIAGDDIQSNEDLNEQLAAFLTSPVTIEPFKYDILPHFANDLPITPPLSPEIVDGELDTCFGPLSLGILNSTPPELPSQELLLKVASDDFFLQLLS